MKVAVEELEQMEMGEEKLERYRRTKALIDDSASSILRAFLWRALVFMVLFVLFLLSITYVENDIVQIASLVVLGVCGMFFISPMLPPPLSPYQQKLKKMMKQDGVRYSDCSLIKK